VLQAALISKVLIALGADRFIALRCTKVLIAQFYCTKVLIAQFYCTKVLIAQFY
jgi:hypothetical protein